MDINRIGSVVRIFGTLLVNGTPTAPTTLTLDITDPIGGVTTYVWNTDPEIVEDSVGAFHFDLMVTQRGDWTYAWTSNSSLTAFESGTIVVAEQALITTVDDTEPAALPVPFVTLRIWDGDANDVDTGITPQRTDATGTLDTELPPGQYRIAAFKLGWVYDVQNIDLTGPGPYAIVLDGRLLESNWLQWEDLECVVDKATIDRLFDDSNTGFRDMVLIEGVIQQAEALAESSLLRSWSRQQIFDLAREDKALRAQAAWFALEMASERRQEFIAADGKGRYWAQYERSEKYFDKLSKSQSHSRGEVKAGKGANNGGSRLPTVKRNRDPFVFAPGRDGKEPGGF